MEKVKVKFEFGQTMNWDNLYPYSVYSRKRIFTNGTKFWGAIVTNYKTATSLDRQFLDTSNSDGDFLINISNVKPSDIIQIRLDQRDSRKYTDRDEVNAIVCSVDQDGLEFIFFDTLFKAVKYYHQALKNNCNFDSAA